MTAGRIRSDSTVLARGVCVTTKSGGTVQVVIGAQTVTVQCPQDLTVAIGDPVVIGLIGTAWHIIQRYFSAVGQTDPTLNPEPPGESTAGTNTFLPARTISYRSGGVTGWRTDNDDIYQGKYGGYGNHTGCVFYGTQIKTLSGATVQSAYLKVRRQAGGNFAAAAATMVHVAEFAKPSGAPTIGGSYAGPDLKVGATNTKFMIDTALAQSLVDGTYGGIGFHVASGTPYQIFSGVHEYAGAFALTITWRR